MKLNRKKLLVAAAGVAAINYSACSAGTPSGGAVDAGPDQFITSGNLVGPMPDDAAAVQDSGQDAGPDAVVAVVKDAAKDALAE
jgi:hypothetical protein